MDVKSDLDKTGSYRWIIELNKRGLAVIANENTLDKAVKRLKDLIQRSGT